MKKVCNTCGVEKDISEFYKDKGYKDGHKSTCKECNKKRYRGICKECGLDFHSEKKSQKYCSTICQSQASKKRIDVTCDYCGKRYELIECLYKSRDKHYCSIECRCKGHSLTMTGKLITSTKDVCSECGKEVIRKASNDNKEIFCDTNCYARWRSKHWVNENHPSWDGGDVEIKCRVCGKISHRRKSQVNNYNYCSPKCMGEDRKNLYSGEGNSNWHGGVTDISEYLRHSLKQWKEDSFKEYEYKCDITGNKKNLIIHHLYNFNLIIKELFEGRQDFIKTTINEYSEEELEHLIKKCNDLHYKYGLGVCLTENMHKEFHSIYGKINNTKEQYEEFKKNILEMKESSGS